MNFLFASLLVVIAIFGSTSLFAIDQAACSKLLNNGLYKKYKYGGIDQPLTKATKEHGISKSTSVTSTEATTAITDPKYWSNITTSETQSTSSWGPCNAIGMDTDSIKKSRDLYFVQNKDAILNEVAKGGGEHLKALATFSLCEKDSYQTFARELQKSTQRFVSEQDDLQLGHVIDQKVKNNSALSLSCYSYII